MLRYKIIIEYDGTNLHGVQSNDEYSVQSILEKVIFNLSHEKTRVYFAGRTDAGVHGLNMVCHFDLNKKFDEYVIVNALNYYLINKDISVKLCEIKDSSFHARFSCIERQYRYLILNSVKKSVLYKNKVWQVKEKLDLNKMIVESKKLIGLHDFSSFRASKCCAKSPIKTINNIEIKTIKTALNDDLISIDISARSFLYKMVRNITGTLVEIGKGKNIDIIDVLEKKNRIYASKTAPACGLYFMQAKY